MSEARALRDKLCIESECTFDRGCGCLEAIDAVLAAKDDELKLLRGALREIDQQYENQNVNHLDFRVMAKRITAGALTPQIRTTQKEATDE